MKKQLFFVLILLTGIVSCKNKKESLDHAKSNQTEEVTKEEASPAEDKLLVDQKKELEREGEILKKNAKAHLSDSLLARIQRTACFGRCPIYTASIYESGRVEYRGEKWVDKEGLFSAKISEAQIKQLFAEAKSIGFEELESVYDSEYVTDLPSCIISLRFDDQVKVVVNRYQGPEKLQKFELYFDQLLDGLQYENIQLE